MKYDKTLSKYVENRQYFYDEFKKQNINDEALIKQVYVMLSFGAGIETITQIVGSDNLPTCVYDFRHELNSVKKELLSKDF